MLLTIHPITPEERKIDQVVDCLQRGGIVVYPTDTVYGIGCDITNSEAVQKVLRYKDVNLRKTSLSFICHDMSHAAKYLKPLDSRVFKLLKKNTPGPFTFILEASNSVPKLIKANKKTVGVRIPDNNIIRQIVEKLGNPILSTSVKAETEQSDDDEKVYITDATLIQDQLYHLADIVIDGGEGGTEESTVVDLTSDDWEIIRQGKGILDDNI